VSSVVQLAYMFEGATSFHGDLSRWDLSNMMRMGRHLLQDEV